MTRRERIETKLRETLSPEHLEIENESDQHRGPKGRETHFRLVVVSRAFEAESPVLRHQRIYQMLKDELASGLHALTITARTPAEWAAAPVAPASPACLGGSKQE